MSTKKAKKAVVGMLLTAAMLFAGCIGTQTQTNETADWGRQPESVRAVSAESRTAGAESTSVSVSVPQNATETAQAEETTSAEQTAVETANTAVEETAAPGNGSISITMLDVGQGLSVLVESDGSYMLYDGGGRAASSYVVSYLAQNGIGDLRYIFASHYDEDHIAGLVGVANTTTVEEAVLPDYTADTKIYRSLMGKIEEKAIPVTHPTRGEKYALGGSVIEVVGPSDYANENENDNSIAIRIMCGDFHCLITGDAEEAEEMSMLASGEDLQADLYVVGHHGSSSSTSTQFLDEVAPKAAFISVGEGNSYGHPTEKTLKKLKSRGIEMYRTDKQGAVTATYRDGQLTFSTAACEDWTPGVYEQVETKEETTPSGGGNAATYILNVKTGKIHVPSCSSVDDMNPENKKETTDTIENLEAQGYEPCKRCLG